MGACEEVNFIYNKPLYKNTQNIENSLFDPIDTLNVKLKIL